MLSNVNKCITLLTQKICFIFNFTIETICFFFILLAERNKINELRKARDCFCFIWDEARMCERVSFVVSLFLIPHSRKKYEIFSKIEKWNIFAWKEKIEFFGSENFTFRFVILVSQPNSDCCDFCWCGHLLKYFLYSWRFVGSDGTQKKKLFSSSSSMWFD